MSSTPKSYGRKTIRATATPRELMAPTSDLKGAWKAKVITLFPNCFPGVLGESLTGKALQEGLWQLEPIDLRLFGEGKHRNVDDTPAGGGAGMVLRADVLGRAIGRLVRCFDTGIRDGAFYLVYGSRGVRRSAVKQFRAWLLDETKMFRTTNLQMR